METSTQEAVQHVPFEERIKKLGKNELIAIAAEEFNLNIDDKLTKEVIRDQLIRCHEDQANSARSMNEKAASLFLQADKKEKLVSVKFLPQDFAHASVEFTNDGGHGIKDKRNPGRNPNGLLEMPRFLLIPGEVYKLPICIIKRLEGLTYRDSKPVFGEAGMITGNIPILKARFLLQVQYSDDQLREMGTRNID